MKETSYMSVSQSPFI